MCVYLQIVQGVGVGVVAKKFSERLTGSVHVCVFIDCSGSGCGSCDQNVL